jgi:hypothetical protein
MQFATGRARLQPLEQVQAPPESRGIGVLIDQLDLL